jgi:Tol biopolymer transport system component
MKAPRVLTSGIAPYCCAKGDRITFVDDRAVPYEYEVWTSRTDGTQRKQITHLHSYIEHPVCAHKTKRILFLSDPSRNGRPELWQVDLTSGNTTRLADAGLFLHPENWGKP